MLGEIRVMDVAEILKKTVVEEVQCTKASAESQDDHGQPDDLLGASDISFEVPDGGTRAWLCVFGFGVFEEYYSANQLSNESLNNISWIGSLQLCLILLVGCVSGPLCDAGYFKHLIGFGGLLFFFSYYQYLLSQGVGVGLAQGFLFTPSMAVLAHHFSRYRTLVFGIFAAGASIGGVILPIALQKLFHEVGFAWGVRFICCTTRYAPLNFGVVYATSHGMSQQLAFYSLAILNAGSLFGRTLPNVLATMFGPLNLLIGSCTVSSISLYVWFTATGNAGILAFEAIYGITSGAYVSCLPAATASLTKNPNETGLRLGMMFFSTSFFWLVSSPIQGALIGIGGSFWPVCVFSGSTVILGVFFMVLSRYLVQKEKATWKV
ncbi:MFS general substrate transporter [Lentinula aciculospora]|uniref:MFS general substrate transporter n=1 Tax=Lentinula aciculospora TaxID=153920 RepID=A0A9W9ABP2_9AGAR|nr:MFS general substrate transporter [Lentinula aciculospora]